MCYSGIRFGGQCRQPCPTRGGVITNDWRISMARSIGGNRATSGSDQRQMYDHLLRPTTDRTINRRVRRPIARSIVTSCDRACDQSLHPATDRTSNRDDPRRPLVRSIVGSNDRSHDRSLRHTTDRTINRGAQRPIVRSIVASYDQSYDQSCDCRSAIIHNWWCHHARLVVRSRKTYLRPLTF